MNDRMNVQILLEGIMKEILYQNGEEPTEESDVNEDYNVYFEPPPNFKMRYPCIRYSRVRYDANYANNKPYILNARYELVAIYYDPDSLLPKKLAKLPMCSHNRHYTADNLSHDVFILYI